MQLYDSLLFHRVIKDFMIQGGDLNSKHAQPGQRLGTGELDYTIEPEFQLPLLYHRRGVVAAAREPDDVNPGKQSGACQFYIVLGKIFNDKMIERVQLRLDTLTQGRVKLTPEMIATYKTIGGTPHVDGQYTVFGEVTQGLEVVDSIQRVITDKFHRPVADVRILRATILQDPFAPKPSPSQPKKPARSKKKR
jgi:peptidyl-prolyl cis-trans isomerase B (cyclophilin B)